MDPSRGMWFCRLAFTHLKYTTAKLGGWWWWGLKAPKGIAGPDLGLTWDPHPCPWAQKKGVFLILSKRPFLQVGNCAVSDTEI